MLATVMLLSCHYSYYPIPISSNSLSGSRDVCLFKNIGTVLPSPLQLMHVMYVLALLSHTNRQTSAKLLSVWAKRVRIAPPMKSACCCYVVHCDTHTLLCTIAVHTSDCYHSRTKHKPTRNATEYYTSLCCLCFPRTAHKRFEPHGSAELLSTCCCIRFPCTVLHIVYMTNCFMICYLHVGHPILTDRPVLAFSSVSSPEPKHCPHTKWPDPLH
jgi:hypothetical protein